MGKENKRDDAIGDRHSRIDEVRRWVNWREKSPEEMNVEIRRSMIDLKPYRLGCPPLSVTLV